jgi:hypothetical protein
MQRFKNRKVISLAILLALAVAGYSVPPEAIEPLVTIIFELLSAGE